MQPKLKQFVLGCPFCQRYNKQTIKYGHLPPKQVKHLEPWEEICVDTIGPWKVSINKFEYSFQALTCVDPVVCLPDVIPVDNASSKTVSEVFEDDWLSRDSSPVRCIHDNGNEFLGPEFSIMLQRNKIELVPTTIKNPQANAIVERMHQSINTMLAISLRENPPKRYEDVSSLIHIKCTAAQYAVRATMQSTLKYTPGKLTLN